MQRSGRIANKAILQADVNSCHVTFEVDVEVDLLGNKKTSFMAVYRKSYSS